MSSLTNPAVTIKVDENTLSPYTDGIVIFIPPVNPHSRDDNHVTEALVAVMAAHLDLCEFDLFHNTEVTSNLRQLWNTIENIRVMYTMRARVDTRLKLDSATRYMAAHGAFAVKLEGITDTALLNSFILGYGHSMLINQPCTDTLYRETRAHLVRRLGESRVCHIELVLDEVPGLASTGQSLEIAQYLEALLSQ